MSWLGRRFPVLRHRDFLLLLADRLIAPGAMAFSIVGVSFAVLDAGGTPADLSYVVAAQLVPCLVFCLLGGVIADRIAPQRREPHAHDGKAAWRCECEFGVSRNAVEC